MKPLLEEYVYTESGLPDHIVKELEKNSILTEFRLPGTTRPLHYKIIWDVDPEDEIFNGTVEIQFVATQPYVNKIVINSHKIRLESVDLYYYGVGISSTFREDIEHQFLIVEMDDSLMHYNSRHEFVYTLRIDFSGEIRKDLLGIYEGSYRNHWRDDKLRWLVSTQFQPTEARTAFPCYDEPGYKATFDITIVRPKKYVSWTGTRMMNSTKHPYQQKFKDVYGRSPPMSTYTIGFIVSEFDSIITSTGGNTVYEVIARRGALGYYQQYVLALTLGPELLSVMGDYTGINYYDVGPNLKLTHAAVPDFLTAGMENWGLVIYREIRLMYESTICSNNIKEDVILTMAHETAHMWFGNMVTCKFWDSIWLNEGFAKYFEYYSADKVYPEMHFHTLFITKILHTVLLSDSDNSTYPLTNLYVGSPKSIRQMFRTITYNKGAAVIRMTEHLLGSEVFKEGIKKYLKDRYLDSAEPIDLFRALKFVALSSGALSNFYSLRFCLIEYYKTWTEQSGHPLLDVIVDHNTGIINITQRKFDIYGNPDPFQTRWIIPITFTKASDPDFYDTKPSHIMREHFMRISRESVGDEWVLFNKQQIGFYRVNYDEYTWDLISAALAAPNQSNIHEYNKAQIVDDTFQFARSYIMSYSRAFQIISFLEDETDYAPWAAAISGFQWLINKLRGTPYLFKLNKKIIELSSKVMYDLSYYKRDPNEDHLRTRLRWMLARLLCNIKEPDCRRVANIKFDNFVNYDVEVPVNDRIWVYCNGLREGLVIYYDILWKRYQESDVVAEKHEILRALGCTPHPTKLNEFLHAIMKDYINIRQHDFITAMESVLKGNEKNTQVVFNFIQKYWDVYFASHVYNKKILQLLINKFRNEEEIEKFMLWAEQNSTVINEFPEITHYVSLARHNIKWFKSVEDELKYCFEIYGITHRAPDHDNSDTLYNLALRRIRSSNVSFFESMCYIILYVLLVILGLLLFVVFVCLIFLICYLFFDTL